jgi:hypothetical protein
LLKEHVAGEITMKRKKGRRTEARPKAPFSMPAGVTSTREPIAGGFAYVFRHEELGNLGRLLVQEESRGRTHLTGEIAGDPDDPMTMRRRAILEPIIDELNRQLSQQYGEETPSSRPPSTGSQGEVIESQVIPCLRCDKAVAMLVFTLNVGTEPDDIEDVTRLMYPNIRKMDVPTFAVGATFVAGSDRREVANIRQVWPERGELLQLTEKELNAKLDEYVNKHCSGTLATRA